MTIFPFTLSSYRNSDTSFPCHFAVHTIQSSYPSHRHDFLELSLVTEGAGKEIVNGVEHAMQPGTFTFLLPYQIHEIHAMPGQPLRLYNCMLGMDLLMAPNEAGWGLKSLLFDIDPGKPAYVQFDGAERETMLALMQSVLEEFEGDRPWKYALVKAQLTEALIRFDRARSGGSGVGVGVGFAADPVRTAGAVGAHAAGTAGTISASGTDGAGSAGGAFDACGTGSAGGTGSAVGAFDAGGAGGTVSAGDAGGASSAGGAGGAASSASSTSVAGAAGSDCKIGSASMAGGARVVGRTGTEGSAGSDKATGAGITKGGSDNLWKVITYIHSNYRDPLSLTGLANRFHFHSTHLSELIHKHTGRPFVRLLHEIRLRHACALLSSTDMKIADIAAEVGYGSTQTLFRAFHNYKGLSPQAYRRLRNSPVNIPANTEAGQPH